MKCWKFHETDLGQKVENDPLVQETKLQIPPNINNYSMESTPSRGMTLKEGGCAIYLSSAIKQSSRLTNLEEEGLDVIWILMKIGTLKLILGTAYIQPDNTEHMEKLMISCAKAQQYSEKHGIDGIVMAGDFNARDAWWNDHTTNNNGTILKKFIENSKCSIISPGTDTFSCTSKEGKKGGSVIDLIVCSESLTRSFECCTVDQTPILRTGAPGRGHWPVTSKIRIQGALDERKKKSIVYSWKGVEWDDWKRKLDETLLADVRIDMTIDPYEMWKYIREDLLKAKDNTVPQKTVCSHSRPYWTESLSHKSLLLRDAQDKYSSWSSMVNREILDIRRIEFESELHDAIDTWTKNNSDNLNTRDKSEFWKAFKRNFKQLDASSNRVDILQKEDGGFIYSNTEKADKLYSTFFTGDHLNGCNFDETFKEEVDAEIKRIASTSQQQDKEELDFNEAYSLEELDAALKKISTANKACDGDGIHPAMIKNMGPVAKSIGLKLYNRCLDEGVWPWRSSKVIFLKKPGKKNYQDPAAYRPICLASNTGKLLERLVEPRMRRWMIQQGLIDEEQEGFMHHKSTTRYLYRLIARINNTKNNKGVGLALMVDFEKAFDSVWVNGLMYKLHKAGWTGKSWNLIAAFLADRNLNIKVGDFLSAVFIAILGLPQGSILAPLLFIFMIADMLAAITAGRYKFADDASLYQEGKNKEDVVTAMKIDITRMFEWTVRWRFKVNCQKNKTELIPINFTPEAKDTIKMGDSELEYVNESKVLGIYVDKDNNWTKQVAATRKKVWYAWKNIKCLCSKYYGLKMATIVNLVKISVIPILLYSAPVWLNKRNLDQFHDVWYDILKTVTGSSCKPSLNKLEILCSLRPLEIQVKTITVKFLIKNYMLHEKDILSDTIEELKSDHKSLVHLHSNHLKEYLAIKEGARSTHNIKLEDHRFKAATKYTKGNIWHYNRHLWDRLTNSWDETGQFNSLIEQTTMKTPCSRATEVYLLNLLNGHINLNKFLWDMSKVESPLCQCREEEETPHHVILDCKELSVARKKLDLLDDNIIGLVKRNKESPETWKQLLQFIKHINETKKELGRKPLKDYFPKTDKRPPDKRPPDKRPPDKRTHQQQLKAIV